ncbi:hypothetical protein MIPYR_10135 [uncultured Microbacterium sp.]|uniref:Uncharacterized protein n=1 Tax=uncultured Microbacterium sp. TaxID=191216 RepID=A0A1Y5NU78_9MICO|nr:hypothetical protein MIPYR_10135 [uncultured Microbacterium sp.]
MRACTQIAQNWRHARRPNSDLAAFHFGMSLLALHDGKFLAAIWPHSISNWLFSDVAGCRSGREDPRNYAESAVSRRYAKCSKRVRVPLGALPS